VGSVLAQFGQRVLELERLANLEKIEKVASNMQGDQMSL
jgi:hypothetical protein